MKIEEVKTEMSNQEKPKRRGRPKGSSKKLTTPTNNEEIKNTGLIPTFKTIFEFIGKTLAVTLSFKKYEITNEESELLATQADSVIVEFTPDINNKYAKLGIFITSLIAIFGTRFFEHNKDLKSKKVKKNTDEQNSVVKVTNVI